MVITRNKFDTQLQSLNDDLIAMGALCENAIACAVKALNVNASPLIGDVVAIEKEIDRKERDIEQLCMKLLLQQQPVAKDLRLISAALKMITDMERIGDQALDIAEIAGFLTGSASHVHIPEMAECVIGMVTRSIDAFVKKDLSIARRVIADDDKVDEFFIKTKNDLINLIAKDISFGEQALDILMIAKYLERLGDHAVNIAEWVVFAITGKHKEQL